MKRFAYLALAVTLPITVLAQSDYSFDDEVNAELNKMYEQSGSPSRPSNSANANRAPQVQVNVQSSPQQSNRQGTDLSAVATSPVSQDMSAVQVQKQPTTLVEAAPLKESRAESLRRARQDSEVQTEQKIVEKLEESRLSDEKRRSDVLFGDKFKQLDQNQGVSVQNSPNAVVNTNQQQAVVPVVVPEQQVAPSKPLPSAHAEIEREIERAESHGSIDDKDLDKKKENKTYFAGLVGMGNYPDVNNVRGKYSLGFSVGQEVREHLLIEGSFVFSQFDVQQADGGMICTGYYSCDQYPRITQMNQYQGAAVAKYAFLDGALRPVLGGALAYTYRTYSDTQLGLPNNDASSNAFDIGVVLGVDLKVSETFSLGMDYRYMRNLSYQTNSQGLQRYFSETTYGSGTPVEKLDYSIMGIVGRATF